MLSPPSVIKLQRSKRCCGGFVVPTITYCASTKSVRRYERKATRFLILKYEYTKLSTLQIVEWAFGKRMTPAERLRKHQRALEKTQRELDRERTKLEQQEKKLVQDIKKNAKLGQMGAVKVQAKDLVRTRRYAMNAFDTIKRFGGSFKSRYIQKFYQMRTQLQAISLRIQVRGG